MLVGMGFRRVWVSRVDQPHIGKVGAAVKGKAQGDTRPKKRLLRLVVVGYDARRQIKVIPTLCPVVTGGRAQLTGGREANTIGVGTGNIRPYGTPVVASVEATIGNSGVAVNHIDRIGVLL